MKKLLFTLAICFAITGAAWAQSGSQSQSGSQQQKDTVFKDTAKAQPHNPNPTKDQDVQRGYDKYQAEHAKNKDNYDVKKSGDTAHGDQKQPQ
jgi:hypothetical protein